MSIKVLKGDIVYAANPTEFVAYKQGYIVLEDDCINGIYKDLPSRYEMCECVDYGEHLIIPGLVDLHVHAPQYYFRGIGMDKELIEWLNTYTFNAEAKFSDCSFAKEVYSQFAQDLKKNGTTRAVVFGTIHNEATYLLMEALEKQGVEAYVGKVNMDRNCPDVLCEDLKDSINQTHHFIEYTNKHFAKIKPIITPRFIPTCSEALMQDLNQMIKETGVPVQSHLSENDAEVEWVKELCPNDKSYAEAYDRYGMLGSQCKSIMAHCVHLTDREIALMSKQDVTVAHCPNSNTNLCSGIVPVRKLITSGVKVGLGSDIAGGFSVSIFRAMSNAISMSKLQHYLTKRKDKFLTAAEAFYLGTSGGSQFFDGKGAFEVGAKFHALVINDASIGNIKAFTLEERIERVIHLADDRNIEVIYQGSMRGISTT